MARLSIGLLGGFQAHLESGEVLTFQTKKVQALLAYLALPLGQVHPRDKLAALLWGEMRDEQARANLRHALFDLRRNLGAAAPSALLATGDTVALDPAAVDLDVATFARLVGEGTPAAIEQATALYQGDLLAGLIVKEEAFETWLTDERERLREVAMEALAKLLSHQGKAGAAEAAVRTALRLLTLDPLQETVHRTLMRLYVALGRRGTALRQYQHCVAVLQRELGVEPETETKQLYQEILQQRTSHTSSAAGTASPATNATFPYVMTPAGGPDARAAETRLVGRESEIAQLGNALDEASAGRGRLVALLGEAGIGKSRVAEELIASGAHRDVRVFLGRAYESDQILPFGPWVDAFRTGRLAHYGEVIEALGPVWRAELSRLLPEVASPGTQPPAGPVDYRRLFESVIQVITKLANRQTLLLVLEDLHWADEMSLRLLAFLGRRVQAERVLVVVTVREEELADAPILRRTLEDLVRARQLVSLSLARLSQPDTVALVRMLAQLRSDAATVERLGEQVWIASEGNPFMIVETMRALEDGMPSQGSPLPQLIREVISRRLERLGDASQSLLAVASVIGREFEFQLLRRASGLDEDSTAEGVEELVRRRVLTAIGERLDFTHDRIREVAYSRLPPWRRKRFHHRIAEAIEELHSNSLEPHYEALATHYREAEVWEKATAYLHQAGNKAVSRSAYRPAVAYFDHALAALAHVPECPDTLERAMDVRLDLRNALVPLGETARITERLREAEGIAIGAADERRLGWISSYMTAVFWRQGDYKHAISSGDRALTIAQALGDLSLEVETHFYLGASYFSLGDYDRSLEFLGKSMTLPPGKLQGRPTFIIPSVTTRLFSVLCHAERGEFDVGRRLGEEGVRLAEGADQPFYIIVALMAVGELHLAKGEFDRSIATLERALELCRTWDISFGLPWVTGALGYAYALSGRLDQGISVLEEVLTQAASVGLMARHSLYLARLSEARFLHGCANDAIALAEQALLLARQHGERGHEAFALRVRGEIAAHQDALDAEKAQRCYRESLELAHGLGMHPLVAHCHLGLGTLYRRRQERQNARQHLAAATALFRETDMQFWSQKAEAQLTEVLTAPQA